MSKEDKQFFDGLLLGSILVGVVLIMFILYTFYRNPQPLGEYAYNNEQDQQDNNQDDANTPEEQEEIPTDHLEPYTPEPIVSLTASESQYITLIQLEDHNSDYVYRLLAKDTLENRSALQNALAEGDLPDCLDEMSGFAPVLSIWDQNGDRLIHINEQPTSTFDAYTICPVVRKWHDRNLIIEHSYGDAGIAEQAIYTYSEDGSVKKILTALTEYTLTEADINSHYQSWSNGSIIFTQYISSTNVSDLMMSTSAINTQAELERATVAYETKQAIVKVDLLSDYNLQNASRGLQYEVGGLTVVLPWQVK